MPNNIQIWTKYHSIAFLEHIILVRENLFGNLWMPNDDFIAYVNNLNENLFAKKIEEHILQKSIISRFVLFKQINFIHSCQYFHKII